MTLLPLGLGASQEQGMHELFPLPVSPQVKPVKYQRCSLLKELRKGATAITGSYFT